MNGVKERLKLPAMGLIAVGLVNALIGVLAVLQFLLKLINAEQLIPVTSCCFVLGIPVGIWSLNILRRPEVKATFGLPLQHSGSRSGPEL